MVYGHDGATYTIQSSDDPRRAHLHGDGQRHRRRCSIDTAGATVTNTDPTVDSITVSQSTGQVGDLLTCSATASDADGGSPTVDYAWSTGDTGSTYTIQASDDPGDVLTCTATASDTDGGSASDTASATVTNTEPVLGSVTISPASANNDDTLTCSATATDVDGGIPTVSYVWTASRSGSLGSSGSDRPILHRSAGQRGHLPRRRPAPPAVAPQATPQPHARQPRWRGRDLAQNRRHQSRHPHLYRCGRRRRRCR